LPLSDFLQFKIGTWALPGGHLEFGETFEECAAREILEETGLALKDLQFLTATNNVMKAEKKHYITIFMAATVVGDNPKPQVSHLHNLTDCTFCAFIKNDNHDVLSCNLIHLLTYFVLVAGTRKVRRVGMGIVG